MRPPYLCCSVEENNTFLKACFSLRLLADNMLETCKGLMIWCHKNSEIKNSDLTPWKPLWFPGILSKKLIPPWVNWNFVPLKTLLLWQNCIYYSLYQNALNLTIIMHAGCKVSSPPSLTPFDLLVVNVLALRIWVLKS